MFSLVRGRLRCGCRWGRIGAAPASLVAAVLLVAGAAVAANRPTLDGCVHGSATAKLVHFGSGGRLAGVALGDGRAGVVFANQSDEDLCGWLPFARATAAQGLRVLAFDFGSGAPQREVAAAAGEL
jgi:hypothetical protein